MTKKVDPIYIVYIRSRPFLLKGKAGR